MRPSCGCSELNPKLASIPPGESQDVRVGIRLQEEEHQKSLTIAISSNDPASPEVTYFVLAECLAPLRLTPRSIDFGTVGRGRSHRAEISVQGSGGGTLPQGAKVSIESNHPHIKASRSGTTADMTISVELSTDTPTGYVAGVIVVRAEPGNIRMEIPVNANVVGALAVAPASIRLAENGADREFSFIVWRPDGASLGEPSRIESPPGVVVQAVGAKGDRRRRFSVRASSSLPAESQVRVSFDGVAEPAVVALRARGQVEVKPSSSGEGKSTTRGDQR